MIDIEEWVVLEAVKNTHEAFLKFYKKYNKKQCDWIFSNYADYSHYELLECLYPKEKKVLMAYFGIGEPKLTLDEIAKKYEVTVGRIRKIKSDAFEKVIWNIQKRMVLNNILKDKEE